MVDEACNKDEKEQKTGQILDSEIGEGKEEAQRIKKG